MDRYLLEAVLLGSLPLEKPLQALGWNLCFLVNSPVEDPPEIELQGEEHRYEEVAPAINMKIQLSSYPSNVANALAVDPLLLVLRHYRAMVQLYQEFTHLTRRWYVEKINPSGSCRCALPPTPPRMHYIWNKSSFKMLHFAIQNIDREMTTISNDHYQRKLNYEESGIVIYNKVISRVLVISQLYLESGTPSISQTSDITCRHVYKQIQPMGKITPQVAPNDR